MSVTTLESSIPNRCANPDCNVVQDGRCVEGFANKSECPHFGKDQLVNTHAAVNSDTKLAPGVALQLATTMSVTEADQALKGKESRVIAIAGPSDAGKTSLIAGLYDLFQLGCVGSVAFAQSYSLHAFEEAAHESRAASRRELPDSYRTPRGEVRFYHLDLVDTASGVAPTVLLGDRAGEEYLETRSNPDAAKLFPELWRADVLTMLIDGQRLLDLGDRHNVRSEIRQTIQAFVEAGTVSSSQRLAVVLTKVDKIKKSEGAGQQTLNDFATFVAALRNAFGSKFASIEPFLIAAQPKSDGAKRGDGLDGLLAYWLAEPKRYQPAEICIDVRPADRYFARLQKPRRVAE
jgi:GTP-binding protein EngB required for normal cell division